MNLHSERHARSMNMYVFCPQLDCNAYHVQQWQMTDANEEETSRPYPEHRIHTNMRRKMSGGTARQKKRKTSEEEHRGDQRRRGTQY